MTVALATAISVQGCLDSLVSSAPSTSDAELLELIAKGDARAFERFYERYGPRVLSYVRMLSKNGQQVEDVVQDVFLAVWRKAASYRPDFGGVAAWLFSITRNRVVDLWRRQGGWVVEEEFDFAVLDAGEPTEASRVAAVSLRQALLRLKPEQREALQWAYFGGLTYEETAQRLQVPLGTLKSRIRAALMTLRTWLSDHSKAVATVETEE